MYALVQHIQAHPRLELKTLKEDLTFPRPFLTFPEPNSVGQFCLSVSCPFMLLLIAVSQLGLSVSLVSVSWDTI
jgi:hypothetical protein